MTHRKPILDELAEVAPNLAAVSASVPYKVPVGYFETLPQVILDKIADSMIIGSDLTSLKKAAPYTVPEGYFDGLAAEVLNRVKMAEKSEDPADELKSISPLLAGLSKKVPYDVPQGYFEKLAAKPIMATKPETAKVISLNVNKVFRYAAAAVVAGVIVVASWMYLSKPAAQNDNLTAAADPSTEQQLLSRIDTISDAEIANFVETGGAVYSLDNNSVVADVAGADFTLLFEDVTDEELERYLQMNQPAKEKFN